MEQLAIGEAADRLRITREACRSRFTLAHADYHWDGVFNAHDNPAMAAQIADASLDELSALIARGKWIRFDSFIAPAVLRGRFDMVHFYCFQDDGDVGIDEDLLAAGHAQQVFHQSAQSLAALDAACPLILDLCLDLFNRADGYFEGDLWSDEEVDTFLHTCRPLIELACLVTISMSFAYSGTRSDTQVEERELSHSTFHLQADAQRPDVLQLEGRFLGDDLALVPWLAMSSVGNGFHDGLPSS